MGQRVGGITLDTAVLDRLIAEAKPEARRIVQQYGLAITASAAQGAPVDTGALRNSITSESGMTGDMTYIVQDGVQYGVFVEMGTHKMAARPFLVPAVEKWRDKFYNAFKELFR